MRTTSHRYACSLTFYERCLGRWCLWRRSILAILAAFILFHAPWRLMALVAETVLMKPGFTRVTEGDARYWDAKALETRLHALSWNVTYLPQLYDHHGQELYGLTSPDEGIAVADYLHWDTKLAVLAHEAGHALHPGWLTYSQDEVFAECVSALYTHDGLREHARYLSRYKGELWVALTEWRRIYRTVALLEN